jgi:hypothetical protein
LGPINLPTVGRSEGGPEVLRGIAAIGDNV